MRCPECNNYMQQLCMYGTDDEINIDYYCEICGCFAFLKWGPSKKNKVEIINQDIPF